jgi:capsular polysaccharide biosynthesis protein
MVGDGEPTAKSPLGASYDVPERLPVYDDSTGADEAPGGFTTALVSLGFIRAALRRSMWLWCTTAVVGLVLGAGFYKASPTVYQASTTLLLVPSPDEQPGDAILTDVALAQSRAVAGRAASKLGQRGSVGSILKSYTVTEVTDRVLIITFSAPSSSEAVAGARVLATEFLQFRAQQAQIQEQIVLTALQQQITQAQQQIKSIGKQISELSAQPASPRTDVALSHLRAQLSQAVSQLPAVEQTVSSNQATVRLNARQFVQGSEVLDAAIPLAHSRYKPAALDAATGLLVGLVLGLGIVILRALLSDRLRRRDDVAYALGAPVKLSVGTVRVARWLPSRRGLAAADGHDVRRIVAHLGKEVPPRSRGAAALAVVPVGDPRVAALALASLALGCAESLPGSQVMVADLCPGAPAGRLLGVQRPGIHDVFVSDVQLGVAVADPDDVVPVGPLGSGPGLARPDRATEPLAAACASADLLLTLAALDPSLGGEHLPTWANAAVVVVTAGQSSFTKIHAVGEMIRLAGTHLVSAVLVGADKADESLGVTPVPGADPDAGVAEESSRASAAGSFVTVDSGPGGGRPTGPSRPGS